MSAIPRSADGYYHPRTEDEVRALILLARDQKKLLRCRGSGHSASAAIYTSCNAPPPCQMEGPPDDGNLNVMLNLMNRIVEWDDARKRVTVEAGCHLGLDPSDPTHTSTLENSLFYQMDQRGWAIPDMGGIIHQMVGGFLATGSSGSSLTYAFNQHLVGLRLIDGNGNTIDLDPSDERFYAAGVSLGLLGVITRATFQAVDAFDIVGQQSTTTLPDCEVDLFGHGGNGKPSLDEFFRKTEHTRLMWWPQEGVHRMEVWKATIVPQTKGTKEDPYEEFPRVLGSQYLPQWVAGGVLTLLGSWMMPGLRGKVTRWFVKHVYPAIVRKFEPLDGKKGPMKFRDTWMHGLPMDNSAYDQLMPTRFIELWIAIEKCPEVMQALREVYQKNGIWASGTYSCEIYPTPASKYWMSAAYGRDVVKVDVFWFGKNKGDPIAHFYPQFWEALKQFNFRPHWGKYLPYSAAAPTAWMEYVRSQYPKWDDFMALRAQMDPAQVFVTEYWRRHLGIPKA